MGCTIIKSKIIHYPCCLVLRKAKNNSLYEHITNIK